MRIVVDTDDRAPPATPPENGQIWLLIESGTLYEMRDWVQDAGYRSCHRVGSPETNYGCDPTVALACFNEDVHRGRWVQVLNCPRSGDT